MEQQTWIGKTIGGRYEIQELLGQGGMSAVYKALDPNLRRTVAVKLIHPHLSNNPEFVRRFEEEAATVAQLRHPHIIQVHDFNHDGDIYYIIFEYVPGESLKERLQKLETANQQMPLREAINHAANVGDALAYAAANGLVHRDVKPANVMLSAQGEAVLMDFGIVKIMGGQQHTATGAVVGTARYMSPEQIKGEKVDQRSDIYSLGIMLFHMLSGKAPFEADSAMTVMMMHVQNPAPDMHQLRKGVTPDLVTVINRAIAKEPDDRYQTAAYFVTDLRKVQAGQPLTGTQLPDTVVVEELPDVGATIVEAPATFPAASTAQVHQTAPAATTVSAPSPAPVKTTTSQMPASTTIPKAKSGSKMPWLLLGCGGLGFLALLAVVVFVGSRFFGGDEPNPTPVEVVQTGIDDPAADEPAPTEESIEQPAAAGFVQSLDEVQEAVIRIEATGTFVDPQVGTIANALGGGSGFIITEDGLAVTNNHVVTGAGILKVFLAGEDNARNAQVVGVSECSDLAVIDIEGEGFTYLNWFENDANVGMDVYAAGFPLGDPEYTLTNGIVSKASADGESNWASVDDVLEHDATINPGNSGGPLVTTDGEVIGVNYAGNSDTNQYYAITYNEAIDLIDELINSGDVTSIGINGTAVNDGEGLSGIWVSSVQSGSPAGDAGIQAGDIIISLENIIMATDGTMSDYCDILRSHDMDDVLSVEVLRFDTGERLEGNLNGDGLVIMESVSIDVGSGSENAGNGETYSNYVEVTDDTGRLRVDVPAEWANLSGAAWVEDDETIGLALRATPDLDAFYENWYTPGLFFGASDTLNLNPDEMLDQFDFSDICTYSERNPYSDDLYSGVYDVWTECDGEDNIFIHLAAWPESENIILMLQVVTITDADLDALDQILNTFIADEN